MKEWIVEECPAFTLDGKILSTMLRREQELIRCKDCKFFGSDGHYCKIRGIGRPLEGDDFCSDGRRAVK